jgi:hypothetical protein
MKRWIIGLMATAMLQAAAPAWGGGGSTFEFGNRNDRSDEFVAVGQSVVGHMDLAFDHRREPTLGPFYAYLRPYTTRWRSPPRIPNGAVPLGRIDIGDLTRGKWTYTAARLEFTVPNVEPGRYLIEYCNNPCTYAMGTNDGNWPTFIVVTPTIAEARLRTRLSNTRSRLESKVYRAKAVADRARRTAERALRESSSAAYTISDLQDEMDSIEARTASGRTWSFSWAWTAVALAAGGFAACFVRWVAAMASEKAKTRGGRSAGREDRHALRPQSDPAVRHLRRLDRRQRDRSGPAGVERNDREPV